VAIGHPDEVTVKILARLADLLDRANVVIVPASELAREAHGEPG
jgi:polysaccharide deacetylase 2 family uncharacterized protein YibQ